MIRRENKIEGGITNLDILSQVENQKTKKYDLIANEIALTYKCNVKIIPYVMTLDCFVIKFYKKDRNETGITSKTESYIQ
jgi:hypothetical protein